MNFYQSNFAAFVLLNAVLAYREYRQGGEEQLAEKDAETSPRKQVEGNDKQALRAFKLRFLPIYLLVNGADWLQVCRVCEGE